MIISKLFLRGDCEWLNPSSFLQDRCRGLVSGPRDCADWSTGTSYVTVSSVCVAKDLGKTILIICPGQGLIPQSKWVANSVPSSLNAHTHIPTHTHTPTYPHIYIHTHSHTCTYPHTHTPTPTPTQARAPLPILWRSWE